MKRYLSILLVTILLGLCIVNFGYGDEARSVTDGLGREVNLSTEPARIVTTIASTTEIALDLGLGERIVGVPVLKEYLSYVPDLQAEAKKKEKVGGYSLSMEKIVALDPDLVIVEASAQKEAVDKLEGLGITVYAAVSDSVSQVKKAIVDIGYLTGTQDRAKKVVGSMVYKEYRLKDYVN